MRQSRKKKRSQPHNQSANNKAVTIESESKECEALKNLMEAFSSVSLEEAASAYREANGNPNKAAEILVGVVESSTADDQATTSCSSSSSGSTSRVSSSVGSSSDDVLFMETTSRGGRDGRGKQKKVIAASGTVSNLLGKEYVSSGPRKGLRMKGHANKEDTEQFLSSMLGEDCELSMAVITDVLCKFSYAELVIVNVENGEVLV